MSAYWKRSIIALIVIVFAITASAGIFKKSLTSEDPPIKSSVLKYDDSMGIFVVRTDPKIREKASKITIEYPDCYVILKLVPSSGSESLYTWEVYPIYRPDGHLVESPK